MKKKPHLSLVGLIITNLFKTLTTALEHVCLICTYNTFTRGPQFLNNDKVDVVG
jgi:hypothetical protein